MVTLKSVVENVKDNGITEEGFSYTEMFKDLGIEEHLTPYSYSRYIDGTFYEGFSALEEVEETPYKEFTFDSNRIGKIWNYLDYTLLYLGSDGKAEASYILFR